MKVGSWPLGGEFSVHREPPGCALSCTDAFVHHDELLTISTVVGLPCSDDLADPPSDFKMLRSTLLPAVGCALRTSAPGNSAWLLRANALLLT